MTVEERANRAYDVRPIGCGNADYEAMTGWLKEILRDQIEDCAKIADRAAEQYVKLDGDMIIAIDSPIAMQAAKDLCEVGRAIRALAASTETETESGVER